MMRLLWKEMRERGWIFALWALAIICLTVFRPTTSFYGGWRYSDFNLWPIMIPSAFALLAGSSSYSSELAKDRAPFIFMRPISWWKMWLAKLIPGIVVLVAAPLISLLICYIFGPACYRPLITAANVIIGTGMVILQGLCLYLLGFFCAPIVSSYAGGIVTIAAVGTIWAALRTLLGSLNWKEMNVMYSIEVAVTVFICIAVLVGGVIVARYSVRLDFQERALRYLRVFALCMALGIVFGVAVPLDRSGNYLYNKMTDYMVTKLELNNENKFQYELSPSGRYALVGQYIRVSPDKDVSAKLRIIDLTTGQKTATLNIDVPHLDSRMLSDNLIYTRQQYTELNIPGSGTSKRYQNTIYQISTGNTIEIPSMYVDTASFAADEKHYFKITRSTLPGEKNKNTHIMLTCYSFPEVHEITTVEIGGFQYAHWLDNNTIVYLDKVKKRQTIRVGE